METLGRGPAASDPFASVLVSAFARIDAKGRVAPTDGKALRGALRRSVQSRSSLLAEPDAILGGFESLSDGARRAVVDAVAADNRWRMAAYNMGPLHVSLAKGLWRVRGRLRYGRAAHRAAELLQAAIQSGPAWALHRIYRRALALKARVSRRPRLAEILAVAGVDATPLAVAYARAVTQLPEYRGYWDDRERNSTVGLVVGLDFIQNHEGYWFLEANLDPGFRQDWFGLYEENPLVPNLVNFAAERGYRRILFLIGTSTIPNMVAELKRTAAARGLSAGFLEDAFRPRFGYQRTVEVPQVEPDTLLVRNRHYRTSLDYILQNKRATNRAIRIYQQESGDTSFRVPISTAEPCPGPADPRDPYPNLVFKFPERDRCEGVFFLKATSPSHAWELLAETLEAAPRREAVSRIYARLDDQQGVFQPFIRTPMRPDRRLHKTRVLVVMTPVGECVLEMHRMVGPKPLPMSLQFGVVPDHVPYALSPGGTYEAVPPEEIPVLSDVALNVARGLSRSLSRAFEIGPGIQVPIAKGGREDS
jgi:hypothetical protein